MSRTTLMTVLSWLAACGLAVTGCSQQKAGPQPPASSTTSQARSTDEGQANATESPESDLGTPAQDTAGSYEDALAELSPEDRDLAEKQKVCPVSGEPLGKMGKPYKVTVQGRDVLLCCSGCESKIKAEPEKYLAKLPQ